MLHQASEDARPTQRGEFAAAIPVLPGNSDYLVYHAIGPKRGMSPARPPQVCLNCLRGQYSAEV